MGIRATLYVFDAAKAAAVLPMLGLSETARRDDDHVEPLGRCVENGRYLIWHNNPREVLLTDQDIDAASVHCTIDVLSVNETTMTASLTGHENGQHVWSVFHDGQKGVADIATFGAPPQEWLSLRDSKAIAQQDDPLVDHMFDVPCELFELRTGFRHDAVISAPFTVLDSARLWKRKRPIWKFWL